MRPRSLVSRFSRTAVVAAIVIGLGVGLFLLGRETAGGDPGFDAGRAQGVEEGRALQVAPAARQPFQAGYAAGANDVFGGFDGGWSLGTPYVITLGKGAGGVAYRIEKRREEHSP
jgi:hypothetical protein